MDSRSPRDGRTIEEVGTYDPLIKETDKRCSMVAERIDYWLSVGALPTDKVKVLIDKYKGKVPEKRMDVRTERAVPQLAPVKPRGPKKPEPKAAAPAPEAEAAPPAEATEQPAETATPTES